MGSDVLSTYQELSSIGDCITAKIVSCDSLNSGREVGL